MLTEYYQSSPGIWGETRFMQLFQFSNQGLNSLLIVAWLTIAQGRLRMSCWTILKFIYHLFITQSRTKPAGNFKYVRAHEQDKIKLNAKRW